MRSTRHTETSRAADAPCGAPDAPGLGHIHRGTDAASRGAFRPTPSLSRTLSTHSLSSSRGQGSHCHTECSAMEASMLICPRAHVQRGAGEVAVQEAGGVRVARADGVRHADARRHRRARLAARRSRHAAGRAAADRRDLRPRRARGRPAPLLAQCAGDHMGMNLTPAPTSCPLRMTVTGMPRRHTTC